MARRECAANPNVSDSKAAAAPAISAEFQHAHDQDLGFSDLET